jgi:hypothetical protein
MMFGHFDIKISVQQYVNFRCFFVHLRIAIAALVGFNDLPAAELLSPGVTLVKQESC